MLFQTDDNKLFETRLILKDLVEDLAKKYKACSVIKEAKAIPPREDAGTYTISPLIAFFFLLNTKIKIYICCRCRCGR